MALSKDQQALVGLCQEVATKAGMATPQAILGKLQLEPQPDNADWSKQDDMRHEAETHVEMALDEIIAWVRERYPATKG